MRDIQVERWHDAEDVPVKELAIPLRVMVFIYYALSHQISGMMERIRHSNFEWLKRELDWVKKQLPLDSNVSYEHSTSP